MLLLDSVQFILAPVSKGQGAAEFYVDKKQHTRVAELRILTALQETVGGFAPRKVWDGFDVQEALKACNLRRGCNSFFLSPILASEEMPLPVGLCLTTNKNKMLSAGTS